MSYLATAARFCTTCGNTLADGQRCTCMLPASAAKPSVLRRATPATIVAIIVALVATGLAGLTLIKASSTSSRAARLGRDLAAATHSLQATQHRLAADESAVTAMGTRIDSLEADAKQQQAMSPAKVAARVKRSVFTVEIQNDLGSGFVVSSTGGVSQILTNFHVVADAYVNGIEDVKIHQGDETFPGHIVDVSEADDLALIEVDEALPKLTFATDRPSVGDSVMAFGSPLGLEGTVSSGIVSALRHEVGADYIQFTAAISPGNSGGPVVDERGDVVGVAEMKIVGSSAENLAFAIPTATVCSNFDVC